MLSKAEGEFLLAAYLMYRQQVTGVEPFAPVSDDFLTKLQEWLKQGIKPDMLLLRRIQDDLKG